MPAKPKTSTKFCPDCKTDHPVEDFAKNKASKDGRYRICKAAEAEWRKQRAAALAAGAPRVIRKGSPGYVDPEAPAEKAADSKPKAASRKRTPPKPTPRRKTRKPTA